MAVFIKHGTCFTVANENNIDVRDQLPAGNYIVKFNDFKKEYFLDQVESFKPIGKLYGKTIRHADRIINTFNNRTASTGIMLNGEKGSGKTLLARTISMKLFEQHIPTIIINTGYCGDLFNQFIQMIEQPCILMFDEFEKVYNKEDQEKILTLLDGVFQQKKMFVFTCNDKYRVDNHMRNRPGRIYYMIDFHGLERSFIEEYCQDNLINKDHIDGVLTIATLFSEFNFDMLKALVEEMNRYNETAADAIELLNAKPHTEDFGSYEFTLFDLNGKVLPTDSNKWNSNPLKSAATQINIWTDFCSEDQEDYCTTFTMQNLFRVDAESGTLEFKNDKHIVVFKKAKSPALNYALL